MRDNTDPDDEKLEFSIQRIRKQYYDDGFLNPIDTALVYYLAAEPYWILTPTLESDRDYGASIPAKRSRFDFDIPGIGQDFDAQFMQLYYASQSDEAQADPEKMLPLAREAAILLREHRDQIPSHRVDELGSMALDAERFGVYDFADALYQLAFDIKPDHPNNMQHYVSFILDTQRREHYERAQTLSDKLETVYPDHKPERNIRFRVQLAALKGEPIQLTPEQRKTIIRRIEEESQDFVRYVNIIILAGQVKDYDLSRQVLDIVLQSQYTNSVSYVYQRLRRFADTLAAHYRDSVEISQEAMEIYRRLLLDPELFIGERTGEADVRHNYATTLYRCDYDNEAGRIWYRAYQLNPNDRGIQNSYASYLNRARRNDIATKVSQGEPIDEEVLQPKIKDLPEQFSDAAYIDEAFALMKKLATDSH